MMLNTEARWPVEGVEARCPTVEGVEARWPVEGVEVRWPVEGVEARWPAVEESQMNRKRMKTTQIVASACRYLVCVQFL